MHLIIDGYSDSKEILQDEHFVTHCLEHYPPEIGMTKISPLYVVKYAGPNPRDWGISGFIFISESHIAIHTFVERSYVNIDVDVLDPSIMPAVGTPEPDGLQWQQEGLFQMIASVYIPS